MLLKSIELKPGYVLRELGGEFNIFHEEDKMNGAIVSMPSINELGIFLWTKLEQGYTCEQLITAVMERNCIDYDEAEMDVGEFLAKMINADLVNYEK